MLDKEKLPTVCVLFMTYNRTSYAEASAKHGLDKINYQGDLKWYIADAGSEQSHLDAIERAIPVENRLGQHSAPLSPGANWNTGIQEIYKSCPIYFRLEDDFRVREPIDITLWVKLLMSNDKVGMIRLGLVPIETMAQTIMQQTITSVGYDQHIYLNVLKEKSYIFSGHPSLVHKRFHDAYGYFHETKDPGLCETDMDGQVRSKDGPEIWIPWDLGKYGTWGNFDHIGTDRSYE